MATPVRELTYGATEVFTKEVLGVGSYGKVCKAKCGQLPCAAKLLHETLFDTSDPGTQKLVERFEQECQFLKAIKHPNIVQFLDTFKEPQSRRLVLLMELMDESLTRFLEQSTGPLPYHTQLNICHDIALALAYLHANDIIHRDLSSNNVLLICEGSRAKVTDFGMSKLIGVNPRVTPLTMCPGTTAYMPPEALVTPPRYSSKLDCFSHGVLTVQIATRKFPNPGDAHQHVQIPSFSGGRLLVQLSEIDRRKKDIDLVDPNHPLLPLALHSLKDDDTERPSADGLCGKLATLKGEQMYTRSVEQSVEQGVSLQILQQKLREKDDELTRATGANHQQLIQESNGEIESARVSREPCECKQELDRQLQEKDSQLQQMREELNRKESEIEQVVADRCVQVQAQQLVQEDSSEKESARVSREPCDCKQQLKHKDCQLQEKDSRLQQMREELNRKESEMEQVVADCFAQVQAHESVIEQLRQDICELQERQGQPREQEFIGSMKLTWRRKKSAPELEICGAAVVCNNTAFFSQVNAVYSYEISQDKWTWLKPCEYKYFSMAVINDQLTTIGGESEGTVTNTLLCLSLSEMKWDVLLPPMPTPRLLSAALSTLTHLIVAGGRTGLSAAALSSVEILDINTLQWSSVSSSPKALGTPSMTMCGGCLYLSEHSTIFSCTIEDLLKSSKPPSLDSDSVWNRLSNILSGSVWTKLANIPVPYWASLTTVRGHVLSVGGKDQLSSGTPTGDVHCYDATSKSWSAVGEMPTPRPWPLVAVLPSHELIVVGGGQCNVTEIASSTYY